MNENLYPEFIKKLPEADLPIEKVVGYLLQGNRGQICFLILNPALKSPNIHMAINGGVVLEGELSLTIGEETKRMAKGDSYYISAGVVHSAKFDQACKVLDFFEDADRYQPK